MDEATELKRIRWRSRRGMRELDRLFDRYLDHAWASAPTAERAVFLRMLDCEISAVVAMAGETEGMSAF